jgi:hypothetical protein
MIGTRRRSFLPNFQKKNCVNLPILLTALQSRLDFPPNLFTPNLLKYPYFAIKHKFFITYIYTNGRSHYVHSATRPVLELHPSNQWDFNWANQIGLNNPATGNQPT